MNNGSIMSEALANNISLVFDHIKRKNYKSANTMTVTLLGQLHMLGDYGNFELLLEMMVDLLDQYSDYFGKGKLNKEKAEVLEVIFLSLNYLSVNIFAENKTIPLKDCRELYFFYIGVVKKRWKEILEYKLWTIIIQVMMFRGGNDPKEAFTYTGEITGVPRNLLKEYVKQSQVGLLAYGMITRNHLVKEIAYDFEDALKAEQGLMTLD